MVSDCSIDSDLHERIDVDVDRDIGIGIDIDICTYRDFDEHLDLN